MKLLYKDEKYTLYYNEEFKTYQEYFDGDEYAISSYEPPLWYVRMLKINDLINN